MDLALPLLPKRAVQYVRMSTDHQRYSIAGQMAAIAEYAISKGYEIVRTYADEGKSGLTLTQRKGLRQLLDDVRRPERDFSVVLVLDVTRWGRFQDPDQSAAYEYFCREGGARVEYVGEAFANDDSLAASLIKHLKRVMAAEFSRELSAKVTQAKKRQAQSGFRMGGTPGYCVRRLLVDAKGVERRFLLSGERKFCQDDKILLRPGTDDEIAVVGRIFRLFVNRGFNLNDIARALNHEAVPCVDDRKWTRAAVQRVLRNELMIGIYVFNRTNQKLRGLRRENPEGDWSRVKVFDPLVPTDLFARAKEKLDGETINSVSDKTMLLGLKRLLRQKGKLDYATVDACPYLPSASTYALRFGKLRNAFEQVGYFRLRGGAKGARKWNVTDEFLLDGLRHLHAQNGRLSSTLIHLAPDLPGPSHFARRFGSLLHAYRLAGFPCTRRELRANGARQRWRLRRLPLLRSIAGDGAVDEAIQQGER